MLGDDRAHLGRDDRHPRRRPRPHLPAPRERDRAEPLRPWRRAARPLLGAQRLPRHGRRREDVEEPRQRRHGRASCSSRATRARRCAWPAVGPLPPAARMVVAADRAEQGDARPALPRRRRCRAGDGRSRRARRLADDLNTPLALSRLSAIEDPATLRASAALLGLLGESADDWFRGEGDAGVDARIAARAEAKRRRDFAEADRIRAELAEGDRARGHAGRHDVAEKLMPPGPICAAVTSALYNRDILRLAASIPHQAPARGAAGERDEAVAGLRQPRHRRPRHRRRGPGG